MNVADLSALEAIVKGLEAAWNAADGAGFAACFTADADFVNIYAMHGKGREAIARAHEMLLHGVYANSVNRYTIKQARLLSDDVALVHISARLDVPQGPMAGVMEALPSAVLVRQDGGWKVAAFHNTLVGSPPSAHNNGQP
jgi:uncharacterized protein (TIGR02246 family)